MGATTYYGYDFYGLLMDSFSVDPVLGGIQVRFYFYLRNQYNFTFCVRSTESILFDY